MKINYPFAKPIFENFTDKPKLLPMKLQFFSDAGGEGGDGGGEGGTGSGEGGDGGEGDDPKISPELQALIDKQIQSATDRLRTDYTKQLKSKDDQLAILKKQSMTAEQIRDQEIEDAKAELAKQRQDLAERENKLYAIDALAEVGMPNGFLPFVVTGDNEQTKQRIAELKPLFDKEVAAAVKVELAKSGKDYQRGSNNGPLTKEQFNSMSYQERVKLFNENPDLYNQFTS